MWIILFPFSKNLSTCSLDIRKLYYKKKRDNWVWHNKFLTKVSFNVWGVIFNQKSPSFWCTFIHHQRPRSLESAEMENYQIKHNDPEMSRIVSGQRNAAWHLICDDPVLIILPDRRMGGLFGELQPRPDTQGNYYKVGIWYQGAGRRPIRMLGSRNNTASEINHVHVHVTQHKLILTSGLYFDNNICTLNHYTVKHMCNKHIVCPNYGLIDDVQYGVNIAL